MRKILFALILALPFARIATGADTVPTDIQLPGTQPQEIGTLESPGKCDNCHGGYNKSVEPAHNWQGSLMAQAGRDPIFWATMAIAEQDFGGSGDLCLRCHSTGGWLAGRSTPTDGSGLAAGDSDGVECDYCHKLTNPADKPLEPQGVMNAPFIANDGKEPAEGWYGSGMSSMWGGSDKLGPYDDADARHQFMRSAFHRDPNFCGTCHDVSNPAVGDVAPNRGTLEGAAPVIASGNLEGAVQNKAAFNNPPYAYGIVERTFSEHMSSPLSGMKVDDFPESDLPRGGAFEAIYIATTDDGLRSADYETPAQPRFYTCQTCHMRAVTGTGANKRGVPVRRDLPLHDMTGGNYWMAEAIIYLDSQQKLRLGGGLTTDQIDAMRDAAVRAQEQLLLAASLEVEDNELEVVNHTGHKLISGYPEGRRMWLNIKWYDANDQLLREDGKYGELDTEFTFNVGGTELKPRTILDLNDPYLHIFEAHMGMTREWAQVLQTLPHITADLPLKYNRVTGAPSLTLGELASSEADSEDATAATFHFVLNNIVEHDNRIPPFQMDYVTAKKRNATPVPEDQYLDSDSSPLVYENYAEIYLEPPSGASWATIDLLYQPTSWEYIQFLDLANNGSVAFLANEGDYMMEAWFTQGMAEPFVMASASWGAAPPDTGCDVAAPVLTGASATADSITITWGAVPEVSTYNIYYDQSDKSQPDDVAACSGQQDCSYTDTGLTSGQGYCYKVSAVVDTECESEFSNVLCATTLQPGQTPVSSADTISTGSIVRTGKGKNATEEFVVSDTFSAGDNITISVLIVDEALSPVSGAITELAINGPSSTTLTTTASGTDGFTEVSWPTQSPNKKGNGGTPTGTYTITVTGVNAAGYDWDAVGTSATIILQ